MYFAIGKSTLLPFQSLHSISPIPKIIRIEIFPNFKLANSPLLIKHFSPPFLHVSQPCSRVRAVEKNKNRKKIIPERRGGSSPHTHTRRGSWPFFRAAPHVNQRSPGTSQGAIERGTEASNRDTGAREQRWARRFSKAN